MPDLVADMKISQFLHRAFNNGNYIYWIKNKLICFFALFSQTNHGALPSLKWHYILIGIKDK